jgi:ABC-type glycerol-3-phosphate transport system permease component
MTAAHDTRPALTAPRLPELPLRPFPIGTTVHYLVYTVFTAATLGPLLWIVMLSFKTRREFINQPLALPERLDFSNYLAVFRQDQVLTFVINSVITVSGAMLIVLVASTLAAYAIARIPFRGRNGLFLMFLIGDSIPLVVIIIPLFILIQSLQLDGSRLSIILPYAAMNMGISIYILRGFFASISSEIEEAGRLDGCNTLRLIWHVILPIARPGLLVVGILNFISFWNEYFLATVIATSQALLTLPAGLAATFVNKHDANWPVMAAAAVLTVVPVMIVFTLAQDKIVRGWATTSK